LEPEVLHLTVSGPSYATPTPTTSHPYQNHGGNFFEVSIEKRDPSIAGELGWKAADATITTGESQCDMNIFTWKCKVTLPKFEPGNFRLVIKEFERLEVDNLEGLTAAKMNKRLVYADAIEI
jgi:hypothetical protein